MTAAEITDPGRLRKPAHPSADRWARPLVRDDGDPAAAGDDDTGVTSAAPYPLSLDIRVTAARELIAEHHLPAAMSAGDVRALLARYQRRLNGLLDAIGGSYTEAGL